MHRTPTALIDAGAATCVSFDQRGYLRPVDGNADGIPACDIGAFEWGAAPPPPILPVNGPARRTE